MESFELYTSSVLGTLVAVLLIVAIWRAKKVLWSVSDIPFALRFGTLACFSGIVGIILYVYFAYVFMEAGVFDTLQGF